LGDEITESFEDFQEESLKGKYLTFIVSSEIYGIRIRYVTEIVGIEAITEMPEMPDYIKGIINLRGKIIPVMDVRLRFGKQERPYDDRTCIIVISNSGIITGLIVDSVLEVLTIPEESVAELPRVNGISSHGFISNIGKIDGNVVLLVDCNKLIDSEELLELAGQ
jgi:purine-binding chemotaxis protein CheW